MIAVTRDLLILIAVTAGPPAALVAVAGSPLPRHLPAAAVWQEWLNDPLQPAFAGATARTAAWLVWAGYTSVILIVLALRLRRLPGRLRRMTAYLPPPVQGLTATILGAAAITTAAAPAGTTAAPPASATAPTAGHTVAGPALQATSTTTAARDTFTPAIGHVNSEKTPHGSGRAVPQHATCTVRQGDTLFGIAARHLGDGNRWPDIFALNKGTRFHRIGGILADPDLVYPGWTLRLPDRTTLPPERAPTAPPSGNLTRTPHQATPGPGTIPPTTRTAGPATPSDAQKPPSTTAYGPRSSAPGTPTPGAATTGRGGVDLGDHGWVAADVAAAVSTAVALLWIVRRRRYRPRPLHHQHDDTDLTPQPAPIAALHHHTHPAAEDHDMNQLTARPGDAATVTTAALGAHHDHTAMRILELPPGGVGLTGAGAPAAARGILTAVLSAGGPWATQTEATIITTRADLDRLLDGATPPYLDRLHIVEDPLSEAERHLLHHARIAADQDDPHPDPAPTVILTAAPTGPAAHRLVAILAIGTRLGITAVLTGTWPHGDTWTIATNGTTTTRDANGAGPRLNILDTTTTIAVLETLSDARPSDDDPPDHQPARPTPTPAHPAERLDPLTHPQPSGTGQRAMPTPRHRPQPTADAPVSPTTGAHPLTTASTTEPPAGEHPLVVNVLGRPHIELLTPDGPRQLRIRRSDGIQILIHLAADPDGATSDQLMAALWPEIRPRYARGRFHTTMSELRTQLHDAIDADAIMRTDERYHLNPGRVQVDLWHLHQAIEHARLTLEPAAHTAALHTLITAHTATLAEGHHWLWLAPYRETIRRHLLDAHVELADTETDPHKALAHIQNAISVDPYNEDLYQRAMHLHAKLASTDGVRRTLRALTERLNELEIRISPQTQQIAADLINHINARHRITHPVA